MKMGEAILLFLLYAFFAYSGILILSLCVYLLFVNPWALFLFFCMALPSIILVVSCFLATNLGRGNEHHHRH